MRNVFQKCTKIQFQGYPELDYGRKWKEEIAVKKRDGGKEKGREERNLISQFVDPPLMLKVKWFGRTDQR